VVAVVLEVLVVVPVALVVAVAVTLAVAVVVTVAMGLRSMSAADTYHELLTCLVHFFR
jgi:hypothetical protein